MRLVQLLECRTALALDADADGRLLVASNLTGTYQLSEHDGDGLRPLTAFDEPVTGCYVPGGRRGLLAMDEGGNERRQLYLFDLDDPPAGDRRRLEPLTDAPQFVHEPVGVSPDGRVVAFVSNRRNGVDFDAWTIDLDSGEERLVYDRGGWCQPGSGFSPDGRLLSLLRPGPRPLDLDLLLVDVATGEVTVVLEHASEAATVGAPAWSGPTTCFVPSDVGRDLAAVVRVDIAAGTEQVVLERGHDLECFSGRDGTTLLVVGNDGGATTAELYALGDDPGLEHPLPVDLPGRGIISFGLFSPPPLVAPDGSTVTFTYSSPVVAGDIWRFERAIGRSTRLTTSPGADAAGDLTEPVTTSVESFDGETIPVFVYRPAPSAGRTDPVPVVLVVHGGPESQSVLAFNPIVQGLVSEGYGVVVPNVRGSTGYGKRFAGLDDTTRRLDSVADLAAIHAWLPSVGLDPTRAALWGGSYGGYMVLAGCAFQPELWAAGVDIVGISDLVTFLERTSDYRRAHREREYGSLERDRDFLERASPLRRADAILAPLFVIHGANDPRVPLGEAEQLAASLSSRGVACELVVYPDEGHGLQKLANRLDAYPRAIEFLNRFLHPAS